MNKYIFIVLLFLNGCLKQNQPIIQDNFVFRLPTLDSVRDLSIVGDSLYLAAGTDLLQIYKINDEDFRLDSLYSGFISDDGYDIIQINIDKKSKTIFVLDRFRYTYAGSLDFFANGDLEPIDCDKYQSKSALINGNSVGLVTIYRHINSVNETHPLTSSIKKINFDEEGLNDPFPYYDENCIVNDNLTRLNYKLNDLHYSDSLLIVANPDPDNYSSWIYSHESNDSFSLLNKLGLPANPLTINMFESMLFIGLDDKMGCYIALLDSNGANIDNLVIADGYTIRSINISKNFLILSTGYDGVLIYEILDSMTFVPHTLISSSYAYEAKLYNGNKLLVGTKSGLEVYKIEL